jgi:8-oxo-dGTP pyrophosphatase MutT (NUDIX family)
LEETGWVVDLVALVGVYQWSSPSGRHFVRFTFAAQALTHDPKRQLDEGIVQALWLTRAQMEAQTPKLRSPFILKSLDDYLACCCSKAASASPVYS